MKAASAVIIGVSTLFGCGWIYSTIARQSTELARLRNAAELLATEKIQCRQTLKRALESRDQSRNTTCALDPTPGIPNTKEILAGHTTSIPVSRRDSSDTHDSGTSHSHDLAAGVSVQERLETLFEEQAADPAWARHAEDALEERLAESLQESGTIRAVECRSSLCRIETLHDDSESYTRFFSHSFKDTHTRIWRADAFSYTLPSDEPSGMVVVSYLAREGESIPSLSTEFRR